MGPGALAHCRRKEKSRLAAQPHPWMGSSHPLPPLPVFGTPALALLTLLCPLGTLTISRRVWKRFAQLTNDMAVTGVMVLVTMEADTRAGGTASYPAVLGGTATGIAASLLPHALSGSVLPYWHRPGALGVLP